MYPLKFHPLFQHRPWGGRRLAAFLGKPAGAAPRSDPIGESWELADLSPGTVKADSAGAAPDGSFASIVANGPFTGKTLQQLLRTHREEIMGAAPLHHGHFPLLVKFLDAGMNLSVQVHPDHAYCAAHPDAHLKCEAWYILHAEPGAIIYNGLQPGTTRDTLLAALKTGDLAPLLNAIPVRPGDCHYLPTGTVHALGAGILAAEVQTPSDTTFRLFDWNRLDKTGKPRTLHLDQALACINFEKRGQDSFRPLPSSSNSPLPHAPCDTSRLAACEHFTIDRALLPAGQQRPIPTGEPLIWIVLEGQGVINSDGQPPVAFMRGETLLLPAQMKNPRINAVADTAWLEVRLPAAAPPTG